MFNWVQLGPTWGHLGALESMIDDVVTIVWRRQTLGVEVEEKSTKLEDVSPPQKKEMINQMNLGPTWANMEPSWGP